MPKFSLWLILAEKSSLGHDIWWIYVPFNVVMKFWWMLQKIYRKLLITESQFYFANISATEARIFMKFYMVVKYYLESSSYKFHEDPCINARAQVVNTHTRDKTCVRVHFCANLHEIWNLSSQDSIWPPYKILWGF